MQTILVQGAAGFVAHSLLPKLIDVGFKHLILADLRPVPKELIEHLQSHGAFVETYEGDSLTSSMMGSEPSVIISLAGSTDVDIALEQPKKAFEANLKIAVDLAEWLRLSRHQVRAIYISSDEVLGESYIPLPEEAPLRPTQPYAASKAAAEIVLNNYRDVYNLNVVTLRSCNLVGGKQRARKLIPVTVKSLLSSQAIPIYGTGEHQREWMAVEDLCEAIILLLNQETPAGIYQAASGVHLSVNEVVAIVAKAIGQPVVKRMVKDRLVHDKSYAMITACLRTLGWNPKISPIGAIERAALEMTQTFALGEFDFIE